ncbi:MAG: L,D-transpeptidase family protein [Rhodobacteraceae bacterium]|jgi:murein L,D-transpeptidase YafK|nr:L,D-transpeptidase family protein [Paracoccaceae bacterium]
MRATRRGFLAAGLAVLAACAPRSKFRTYDGPEVTGIVVSKSDRRMYLVHHGRVLKRYRVDLGRAPAGPKRIEGDGKTPEGTYVIDRRNPDSRFHLSLGISYPSEDDRAQAAAVGESPGGDIFIHGRNGRGGRTDWTEGCIAVTDREMEEIYAMVRVGTPITIHP